MPDIEKMSPQSGRMIKEDGTIINRADILESILSSLSGFSTEEGQEAIIAALGNIKIDTGDIDLNTDGLEGLQTLTNSKLDLIKSAIDLVKTNTDTNATEAKQNDIISALGTPAQSGEIAIAIPDPATEAKQDTIISTLGTPSQAGEIATAIPDPATETTLSSINGKDFATSAKQDLLLAELQLKADLSETQPVSAASLPLPSGASKESKQDAIIENQTDGSQKTQANNYLYNEEDEEWVKQNVTNIGIHLCAADIATTTGFVLIDLSDTVNFPHNNSNSICITGYQISINPNDAFVGQVLIGFLENVDDTNGDFKPVICWKLEKKSEAITDSLAFNSPICTEAGKFLVVGNIDDTTWQTDTALASPIDNTAPYTTAPGNGDLVMKIVRTAGEVNVGVTIKYFSK